MTHIVTITDSQGRVTRILAKAPASGKSPIGRACAAFIAKSQGHMRKLLPLAQYTAEFNGDIQRFSFGRIEGGYVQRVAR